MLCNSTMSDPGEHELTLPQKTTTASTQAGPPPGFVENRQQFSADALSQDDTKPDGDEDLPFGPFVNAQKSMKDLEKAAMFGGEGRTKGQVNSNCRALTRMSQTFLYIPGNLLPLYTNG
eukprot:768013-Hanusia_phi.AAC.2